MILRVDKKPCKEELQNWTKLVLCHNLTGYIHFFFIRGSPEFSMLNVILGGGLSRCFINFFNLRNSGFVNCAYFCPGGINHHICTAY